MLASAEAEIGEGVYWKVKKKKKKRERKWKHITVHWPLKDLLSSASLTCTRAGCLVVLGLPSPAFITSWLHWDLHPTTHSPPPSARLLRLLLVWERRRFRLSEPGNPLLELSPRLAHRLWKTFVWKNRFFFFFWAVGGGGGGDQGKDVWSPNGSQGKFCCVRGKFAAVSLHIRAGDLLYWVFSPSLNSVVLFRLLVQWIHYWKQLPAACSENCSRLFLAKKKKKEEERELKQAS